MSYIRVIIHSNILYNDYSLIKVIQIGKRIRMYIDYLCNHPEYVETVSNWIYSEFVVESEKSFIKLQQIIEYFKNTNSMTFPITLIAVADNECVGSVSIFENDLKTQNDLTPWLASYM